MKPRGSALARWEAQHGPNMTPMVDVVMVILIFFMAAMSFVGPEWFLKAALPVVRSEGEGDRRPADAFDLPPAIFTLRLARAPGGETRATGLGLEGATLDVAAARLRSMASELSREHVVLQLVPDPEVAYRDVVRLCDEARRAGVRGVGLGPLPRRAPGSSSRGEDLEAVPPRGEPPRRAQPITQGDKFRDLNRLDLARVEIDEQVRRTASIGQEEPRLVLVEEDALHDPCVEQQADRAIDRRLRDSLPPAAHRTHELVRVEEPVGLHHRVEDPRSLGRVPQPLALEFPAEDRAQRLHDPQLALGVHAEEMVEPRSPA